MPTTEPFPDLDEVLASMGAAGERISEIDASEAGAGNISAYLGWDVEVRRRFPVEEEVELPWHAPSLAGHVVLVTGSGRRLRQIARDPLANVGALRIHDGRRTPRRCTARRTGCSRS